MELVVRPYRPADRDAVRALYGHGVREHIVPCFKHNMSSPLYLVVTLALCVVGYVIASVLGAVVLPALWMSLIYYSVYYIYDGFVRRKLVTDMQDISGNYMSRPNDCLWVAEAEVDGRVVGFFEVNWTSIFVGKRFTSHPRGFFSSVGGFSSLVWWLLRVSNLEIRSLANCSGWSFHRCTGGWGWVTGWHKLLLISVGNEASARWCWRPAAVALYKKVGFCPIGFQNKTDFRCGPLWIVALSNVNALILEKQL